MIAKTKSATPAEKSQQGFVTSSSHPPMLRFCRAALIHDRKGQLLRIERGAEEGGRARHREGQKSIIGTPATGDLLRSGQVAGQSESEVRVALPWSRQAQAQLSNAPKPAAFAGISPLAAVSKARRGYLKALWAAWWRNAPPLQPLSLAPRVCFPHRACVAGGWRWCCFPRRPAGP